MFELQMFNASHEIRRLSFGEEYPGMPPQPLDGVTKSVPSGGCHRCANVVALLEDERWVGMGQYNYYVSVVPTVYTKLNGRVIRSNQYSYTEKVVEVESTARRFPHPGAVNTRNGILVC